MRPDISEFSYGFALSNELVGLFSLKAAPIFPSLIEEGKCGGGYDVNFDIPGFPLFLQFKRAEFMKRRSAQPYAVVKKNFPPLSIPFFRFPLMEISYSIQHELLLALDTPPHKVFYAAPRFHTVHEINKAWEEHTVIDNSIFIEPHEIGPIFDTKTHVVAFDSQSAYFCSEPKPLDWKNRDALLKALRHQLDNEGRPLREVILASLEACSDILRRLRHEG